MQFETLGKKNKKKILIGGIVALSFVSVISFVTTRAKYTSTQNLKLANGTVNYKSADLELVAIKLSEDGTNYTNSSILPTGDYQFNSDRSKCRMPTSTLKGEEAPVDNSITIEYTNGKINILGMTTKNTKCYIYFDKISDTTNPTISNISATVTKTTIDIEVTASDTDADGNTVAVSEYWYALDTGGYVQETSATPNKHTFSGLTAGQSYTVKVKVVDAAGNYAEDIKDVTTTPNGKSVDDIIASLNAKTTVPTFSDVVTANQGVYRTTDGMYNNGYTYYWRGAATTNHVIFADKCWRIIRINGDKTIRLIYNGDKLDGDKCTGNGVINASSIAETSLAYNSSTDASYYVGWTYGTGQRTLNGTASNAKTQTESWYKTNITDKGFDGKVATGKFCNDRNMASGVSWAATSSDGNIYYAGHDRSGADDASSVNPTLACNSGDTYTLKVGAITMDEIVMAGGKYGTSGVNRNYYLYNGQSYWAMTPNLWGGTTSKKNANIYNVYDDGRLGASNVSSTNYGIRPVINLESSTEFATSGSGTATAPYVVL